jgi:ribosomal protein L29
MEAMREAWTDDRLDDLNHKVGEGFARVDAGLRTQGTETKSEFDSLRTETKSEFDSLRSETKSEFASLRKETKSEFASIRRETKSEFASLRGETKSEFASLRGELNERFKGLDDRFDSLQRTLILAQATIVAALIGLLATQL